MTAIEHHRIAGTRITVWDVLHHLEGGWSAREIADVFSITVDQIETAIDYIDNHQDEVMEVHRRLQQRNAQGNPPEIVARAAAARANRLAWQKQQELNRKERSRVGDRT